jgi:Arc/MetJ-type ribon-helix-helix transcriptional regulator
MRQVLSISLTETELKNIKEKTKKRGFSSVSAYLKRLVQEDEELISVEEVLAAGKRAEQDYKAGKLKPFTPMNDLKKHG